MPGTGRQIESVMDPTAWRLAEVYAQALLELLEADDRATEARRQLELIVGLLDEVDGFEEMLAVWPLDHSQRVALVEKLFAGRFDGRLEGLLFVMARNGRLDLLRQAAAQFGRLLDRRQGKVEATVTTAWPLDAAAMEDVVAALREILGAEPLVRNEVDGEVLGGMVLKVGDHVYDASVAAELARLKRQIARRIEGKAG